MATGMIPVVLVQYRRFNVFCISIQILELDAPRKSVENSTQFSEDDFFVANRPESDEKGSQIVLYEPDTISGFYFESEDSDIDKVEFKEESDWERDEQESESISDNEIRKVTYNPGYAAKKRRKWKKHNEIQKVREKNFKCDICDYATVGRRQLATHILNHTGEKPFKKNCHHESFIF
jgi:ribosomal protein L37AE/L43A